MGIDDKGYKDTKEFICTGCGKTIVLTKFASQKTCRCDECKAKDVPINPDIVADALKKNPPKDRKKSSGGETKIVQCVKCGQTISVSKFMSASKALCDECKGVASNGTPSKKIQIDKSRLGLVKIAPIEEYDMNIGIIRNKSLREVSCPSCGHKYMRPLMVVDWSQFGLVVEYQCQKCYTVVNLSEQHKRPLKIHNPSERFDYTGTEIKDLGVSMKENSRLANALCKLIDICEKNEIAIDDAFNEFSCTLPPYRFENDKPVPKGFVIPPEDVWIKTVHDAYELLKNSRDSIELDKDKYLEKSKDISDKLDKLLKGENYNNGVDTE